jgi:hypothetical protein
VGIALKHKTELSEQEMERRCQAIERGEEQENYKKWLEDEAPHNFYVREALAQNGYCLQELAKDQNIHIRTTIMRYPESIKYVLAHHKHIRDLSEDEWILIYETLQTTIDPDVEALADFTAYGIPGGLGYYRTRATQTINAFRAQIYAHKREMTLLEKTMTSKQLYDEGNLHWVRGLSAKAIENIQYAEEVFKGRRAKVSPIFNNLITDGTGCDYETMVLAIDRAKRIQPNQLLHTQKSQMGHSPQTPISS